jgi:hypothetical protein
MYTACMQSERIESQKRAKTVSRVNLALYLICMLSFTGCCSTPCADWCKHPQFRDADGRHLGDLRKLSELDSEDIPVFPSDIGRDEPGGLPNDSDVGRGEPSGIPILKCPNRCCPRQ